MTLNTQNWQTLQQSAERARQAAEHEQAIDLYNQALAHPRCTLGATMCDDIGAR
jgi:hypothetical protein